MFFIAHPFRKPCELRQSFFFVLWKYQLVAYRFSFFCFYSSFCFTFEANFSNNKQWHQRHSLQCGCDSQLSTRQTHDYLFYVHSLAIHFHQCFTFSYFIFFIPFYFVFFSLLANNFLSFFRCLVFYLVNVWNRRKMHKFNSTFEPKNENEWNKTLLLVMLFRAVVVALKVYETVENKMMGYGFFSYILDFLRARMGWRE